MSPLHPASLHLSGGDTPEHISRDLGGATYVSHHSHMSKPPRNPFTMNINTGGQRDSRALDNTENRFELFLLGDGEKKVTEEADTSMYRPLLLFEPYALPLLAATFELTQFARILYPSGRDNLKFS